MGQNGVTADHNDNEEGVKLTASPTTDAQHPSDVIGDWGPVQRRILIFLTLIYIVAPLNNASIVFYQPKYDFFCHYTHDNGSHVMEKNACDFPFNGTRMSCSSFTYDDTIFKRTLVSEFDLVCSRSYYGSVSQSMHQFGYMVSGLFLGHVSDRYGRLFAARTAIVMEILSGMGMAFAPSILFYWVCRFLGGFSAYGRFLASYVLLTEWVGPNERANGVAIFEYGWLTGAILLPGLFALIPDFRLMQAVVTMAELLLFVPVCVYVWESPRWLLTHAKYEEADKCLTSAAKANQKLDDQEIKQRIKSIRQHADQEVLLTGASDQTVFDTWRCPELRRLSLILYFLWFGMAFLYHAFTMNVQNLGGDLFINFALFSVVDLVTHTILFMVVNRVARKHMLFLSMFIQIVSLIALLGTSFHQKLLVYRIIASCGLRAGMSISYFTIYLYSAETFPTTMRQACMGMCSIFARIGSMLAPFVKELTLATHLSVPTGIFLLLSVTNVILLNFVPETGKIQMPDTIQQKTEHVVSHSRRGSRVSRRQSLALTLHSPPE